MTATYRVFGLNICFPRDVPTLRDARVIGAVTPDVHIVFGHVPARLTMETVNDDLDVAWDNTGMTITVEEVGRFYITGGDTIVADPFPETSEAELDLYLAGSIMGALLHQRSILPIHCNAFSCGDYAILICGDSGAGKSTLAAWFETKGLLLITDDVCAVTFTPDGQAMAHPGIPRLRLWQDALHVTGRKDQAARPVPWAEGKFELDMASSRAKQALPIAAIYHLNEAEDDTQFSIEPLQNIAATNAITSNIYRRRLADLLGKSPEYLYKCISLIKSTPMFSIDRTWGMENYHLQSNQIYAHIEASVQSLK